MTSQPPPTYTFSGIDYNPNYFNTDTGTGLTTATANTLYLRKTFPDTATSEETFSGGINTSDITVNGTLYTSTINDSGATLDINGQAVFTNLAPHCDIVPEYSNDLCNKSYVDSRISSGGQSFLYCNYSAIVPILIVLNL